MGIVIIIRNYLGIPVVSKCISRSAHFFVDYDELLSIIEGYIASFLSIEHFNY